MFANELIFNLQMFSEGTVTPGVVEGSEPQTTEETKPPVEKKPFAIFDDEESFKKRLAREAKRGTKDMLTAYGLESEDELKKLIEGKRAEEELKKSELDKALEKIAKLETENNRLVAEAVKTAKNTVAKTKAIELGVKPERVDYLLKLIDLDAVEFTDGNVDVENMTAMMEEVLTAIPELKTTTQKPKGGTDFNEGANDRKPMLTKEMVSRMSAEEIASRIDEVRQVLSN